MNHSKRKPKLPSLFKAAEKSLKKAVEKVIEEHRRHNQPMVVWEDGHVREISTRLLRRHI